MEFLANESGTLLIWRSDDACSRLYGTFQHDYEHNFQGMTAEPVPLDSLLAARGRMVRELQRGLDDNERRVLLSLVAGTLDWSLLGIVHLEHLPGIRWKLYNLAQLQKTNAKKFAEQADILAAKLTASASRH